MISLFWGVLTEKIITLVCLTFVHCPYQDMASYVKQCSEAMYEIADGTKVPTDEKAESIPMIAY